MSKWIISTMMLGCEVLCFLTLFPLAILSYMNSCPPDFFYCFCSAEFTVCKNGELNTLPPDIDPQVKSLDLSNNNFQKIPPELSNFAEINSLNFSDNIISVLGHSDFRGLTKLQLLDLSHNMFRDWRDIRSEAVLFSKLMLLDLSHNPLGSMPGVRNPLKIDSLEVLRLKNCSMRALNSILFTTLPNLRELHLSGNPIGFLSGKFSSKSLIFLDLSNCNLGTIYPDVFVNLIALKTLWIFQNLNLKTFPCSSNSLSYVDLTDCNLDTVPNGRLPNLSYANFHGNHFRSLPNYSFMNMSNLTHLDLSYNTLRSIEERAFYSLDKVKHIDLSFNTLTDLSRGLFYTNQQLSILNLSYNHFNSIQRFASQSLTILDVSSCEINNIDKDSLTDMPQLRSLNIAKNVKLSSLPDYFQGLSLMRLDVSLCRIKSINNRTFASMTLLRQLNLAGNRLTVVHPEYFTQVTSLDISDNPWRCDCPSLRNMYIWVENSETRTENLLCESPQMYEGLTWLTACQEEWQFNIASRDTVWMYITALIVTVILILFVVVAMKRLYLLKEKRLRQAAEERRTEERETLTRMRRIQLEAREEASRNAPDPRELQTPPSYNEALLLPKLDSSHPSLSGSLHSLGTIGSKHSLYGSNPDVRRTRPRRKRRRRKSESSEGQRASRVVVDSDTASEPDRPQPRTTLESDF